MENIVDLLTEIRNIICIIAVSVTCWILRTKHIHFEIEKHEFRLTLFSEEDKG